MWQIRRLTMTSIILSLILTLGLLPISFISIGIVEITIMPAIVISILCLCGLYFGIIAGLAFGISSLLRSIMFPSLFTPFFVNPLVSIVPRVLFVFIAYYIFKFMCKVLNKILSLRRRLFISSIITAIFGTIAHTLFTLSMIWLLKDFYSINLSNEELSNILLGLIFTNLFFEIIISVIVVSILVPSLYSKVQSMKLEFGDKI